MASQRILEFVSKVASRWDLVDCRTNTQQVSSMTNTIFKIVSRSEWTVAERLGEYRGATLDIADGFIHFSAADQTLETAAKHFAGQRDLLLVSVDVAELGENLRWETSRGGALFPHLYGVLPLSAVRNVQSLPIGDDGAHRFPVDFET
ncbi:MAG: DUF952 domain-containing protein [Pirellulaceae bacterium]